MFDVVKCIPLYFYYDWNCVILQYVVPPSRRSTAEAFQILFSHALGDASSPYIIGLVRLLTKTL